MPFRDIILRRINQRAKTPVELLRVEFKDDDDKKQATAVIIEKKLFFSIFFIE